MPDAYELDPLATRATPAVVVKVRRKWSDPWEDCPYLFANSFTLRANPGIGEARLEYRYGLGRRRDAAATEGATEYERLDLLNHFVWVQVAGVIVPNAIEFHGVIVADTDQRDGAVHRVAGDDEPIASGVQRLTAVGLAYLLDREPITRAYVRANTPGDVGLIGQDDSAGTTVLEIPRAIGWNLGAGRPGDNEYRPNRDYEADTTVSATAKVFSRALDDARQVTNGALFWFADDIASYALKRLTPAGPPLPTLVAGQLTTSRLPQLDSWKLDDGDDVTDAFLASWKPAVQAEGRTVKEVLDELMNRRRLTGYRVSVDSSNTALVTPFTFSDEDLTLPDGSLIDKNTRQYTLTMDELADGSLVVHRQASGCVRQVVAQGEFRGAVCNLSYRDPENSSLIPGTLLEDWSATQADLYNKAASTASDYPADAESRRIRNAQFRLSDVVKRVFSFLRLPAGWTGYQGAQSSTYGSQLVFPKINADGTVHATEASPIWPPGLRISRFLPFKESLDYSSNNIAAGTVTSLASDDPTAQPEWRPMLGLVKDPDGRWRHLEHVAGDRLMNTSNLGFAVTYRPQEDAPGLVLDVQPYGPSGKHIIAYGSKTGATFTAADSSDDWPTPATGYTWDYFLFVVRLECDERAEARYPADADLDDSTQQLTTLYVPMPGCFLDWVPGSTIVNVKDGVLERTAAAGGAFVRDDRPLLQRAARLAYEWYSQPRRAIDFSVQRIEPKFEIGDLITSLESAAGSEDVQAVITEITYDLLRNTTHVRTDFGELDAQAVARKPV